ASPERCAQDEEGSRGRSRERRLKKSALPLLDDRDGREDGREQDNERHDSWKQKLKIRYVGRGARQVKGLPEAETEKQPNGERLEDGAPDAACVASELSSEERRVGKA